MPHDSLDSSPMPLTRETVAVARLQEQVGQIRLDLADLRAQQLRDTLAVRAQIEGTGKQNELILQKMNEARGGWKLFIGLGGVVTAITGGAAWIMSHIKYLP